MLVVYVQFTEHRVVAERGEAWASRRFFGPYPSAAHYYAVNSFGAATFSPASESGGTANDGVVVVDAGPASQWDIPSRNPGESDDAYLARVGAHEAARNGRALRLADASVDFASFDANNDGAITFDELTVAVMEVDHHDHSRYPACGATRGLDVGDLDGKRIAIGDAMNGSDLTNLFTWAHELMHHAFGMERDWYQYGINGFDVMSETCTFTEIFNGINAWNKMHLGWVKPTVVTRDGYYDISRADSTPQAYLLYDPQKGADDYFLVENRYRRPGTYDSDAGDRGLVIWRIDEKRYYEDPADARPISIMRPCDPTCPADGSGYMRMWDATDVDTPQREMTGPWNDGTRSRVAVRAISGARETARAYFDVPGPGVLVDCFDAGTLHGVRTFTVYPGEPNRVELPVMNTGDLTAQFEFFVEGPPGWRSTSVVRTLDGHVPATVALDVTPPDDAPTTPHQLRLVGRSTADGSIESRCDFRARVDTNPTSVGWLGDASVRINDRVNLSARLTDSVTSTPVVGAPVRFEVRRAGSSVTSLVASATTDARGIAQATPVARLGEGDYEVKVTSERFRRHEGVTMVARLRVDRRPLLVSYTGDRSGQYTDPVRVSAALADAATGEPVRARLVQFGVGSQRVDATTDAAGLATALITLDQFAGDVTASATFGGDGVYLPTYSTVPFVVSRETVSFRYTGDTLTTSSTPYVAVAGEQEPDLSPGNLEGVTVDLLLTSQLDGSSVTTPEPLISGTAGGHVALSAGVWDVAAQVSPSSPFWQGGPVRLAEVVVVDVERGARGKVKEETPKGRVELKFDGRYRDGAPLCSARLESPGGSFDGSSCDWVAVADDRGQLQVAGTWDGRPGTLRLTFVDGTATGSASTVAATLTATGRSYRIQPLIITRGHVRTW